MGELPKYVDATICAVYKIFRESVDSGAAIADAKEIGTSSKIHKVMPKFNEKDVDEACRKLSEMGYLKKDVTGYVYLKDDGIAYMENRFKNGLKEVVELLGNLIP